VNTIRLLDLPPDILTAVIEGRLMRSHARTLLSEPNPHKQRALFERMLGGGVTVRHAESVVSRRIVHAGKDPNIAALESVLREKFGTKVTIETKDERGMITIYCYSKDDLAAMIRRLSA
jgi:ParB family chromosome partitioning protein